MLTHQLAGTILIALLGTLALFGSGQAAAAERDGAALYQQHCAPCHGPTGRGDGPSAGMLKRRPANLRETLDERPTDAVVQRILDGGSLQLPLDLAALRARAADTQVTVAYLRRLPEIDWRTVDAGAAVYADRCSACHGTFGHPPVILPPGVRTPVDLSEPHVQALRDVELVVAVRHGRDGMPALVPRLTDTQARAAAAYVRQLSPGYETYTQYCAVCHGRQGRAEGDGPPSVVFDRTYFANRDPEELRRGVWHMVDQHQTQMPHFRATLSPSDAAAIVEWLRTAPPASTPAAGG